MYVILIIKREEMRNEASSLFGDGNERKREIISDFYQYSFSTFTSSKYPLLIIIYLNIICGNMNYLIKPLHQSSCYTFG